MNEELEQKIRLWDHLARTPDKPLSALLYEGYRQAHAWNDMVEQQLKDQNSNTSKEITLITEFLKCSQSEHESRTHITLFDIGSGTGHKAFPFIDHLPDISLSYFLVDQSRWLRDIALSNVQDHCRETKVHFWTPPAYWAENSSGDYRNFLEDLFYHRFDDAFDALADNYRSIKLILHSFRGATSSFMGENDFTNSLKQAEDSMDLFKSRFKNEYEIIKSTHPHQVQDYLRKQRRTSCNPAIMSAIFDTTQALAATFPDPTRRNNHIKNLGHLITLCNPSLEIDEEVYTNYFSPGFPEGKKSVGLSSLGIDFSAGIKELSHLINERIQESDQTYFMLLGNTLANFEDPQQVLSQFYSSMNRYSRLMLGIQLAPSPDSPHYPQQVDVIKQAYGAGSSEQFLRSATQTLGIPDESLEFQVDYHHDTVCMSFACVEDLLIKHPAGPHSLLFPKGASITMAQSRKFNLPEVKEMLEHTGFEIDYLPDRTDYALVVAKK